MISSWASRKKLSNIFPLFLTLYGKKTIQLTKETKNKSTENESNCEQPCSIQQFASFVSHRKKVAA